MLWKIATLRKGDTWANGGTFRLDLPKQGLVSSIYFHVYRAGVTDSMIATEKWRLLDFISELKVVANGSLVLKQLTGRVQHYLTWRDGGPLMRDQWFNYGSSTRRFHAYMNFGRYPYDTDYGLDLSMFDNVELRFTNDGSSSYFGGDWAIDVFLVLMEGVPNTQFAGHFRTEEYRKWTTVADEHKYIQLPTDGLLRRMVLQVDADVDSNNVDEIQGYHVAEDVKLTVQSGALELFDLNLRDLWHIENMQHGRDAIVGGEWYTTDAYGIRTGLGQSFYKAASILSQDGGQSTYAPDFVPGLDGQTQVRQCDGENTQFSGLLAGIAVEDCMSYYFEPFDSPAGYLDLNALKTVDLDVHTKNDANAADGEIRLMLDRLFPNR
jgi:hypothetical protein